MTCRNAARFHGSELIVKPQDVCRHERAPRSVLCPGRIVSCRVLIEAPHRHHQQGRLYRVRIEIGVPGEHIVVGRSPDEDSAHADPHVAVRDAFRAAKRQLEDHVGRLRPDAADTASRG